MKKIKKIGVLVVAFIFNFCNICFADAIMLGESPKGHGLHRYPSEPEPINYILIGILVLVIVVCAVMIIRRMLKKNKEKSNDNK